LRACCCILEPAIWTSILAASLAGLHSLYPQATSVVQLLPYGWNTTKPGGNSSVVRGGLYKKMADIQNIAHHYWINGDAKNAFFHQCVPHTNCAFAAQARTPPS